MKLNLLPTTVSRERNVRKAVLVSLLMALASIGLSVSMVARSKNDLESAKAAANADIGPAQQSVDIAAQADIVIRQAAPYLRNINLVKSIDDHTKVYPDFYKTVLPLLPDFYRITSMRATPVNSGTVAVNFSGVIRNDLYHDMRFALMRLPKATNVQVTAVPEPDYQYVPSITPADEAAHLRNRRDPPIPDDGMARLNQALTHGGVTGFLNQGNFGSGTPAPRQAMPNSSIVNVSFMYPGQLQAPNIRATLAAVGPAPAPRVPTATAASASVAGAKAPVPAKAAAPAKPATAAKPGAAATPASTTPAKPPAPSKAGAAKPAAPPAKPAAPPAKATAPAAGGKK